MSTVQNQNGNQPEKRPGNEPWNEAGNSPEKKPESGLTGERKNAPVDGPDDIPAEKFTFVQADKKLHDVRLETKPIGYFQDAWMRFQKDASAVVAFVLILLLLAFAVIVPFVSTFDVAFRDSYYKTVLPKAPVFVGLDFWDGCSNSTETQAGYDYLNAIGQESGESAVKKLYRSYESASGAVLYRLRADSYARVGYVFVSMSTAEFQALQDYQNETGIQVIYPMPKTYNTDFVMANGGANFWYQLADESKTSTGLAVYDENGSYIPNYITSDNENAAGYDSLRIAGDDGGADGKTWDVYAVRNQSGVKIRVNYHQYFLYQHPGVEPVFYFGTNIYGQDIFTCLAAGARLSFLLAFAVSFINFVIGIIYGSIEGYYGGTADLIMERISDILYSVPFIVVATLFQLHLADRVGVLGSLLFAFVMTGWVGIASTVRMQFYRFKGQEYVLAARTLGASDRRLIFKHIFPNALGTIITSSILTIPGVIFSESILSYLHIINLETSSLTSIGTMLSNGQGYLSTYPHIILFPAIFISLLEISFNLFGNGLRDAFNPSLRGAD